MVSNFFSNPKFDRYIPLRRMSSKPYHLLHQTITKGFLDSQNRPFWRFLHFKKSTIFLMVSTQSSQNALGMESDPQDSKVDFFFSVLQNSPKRLDPPHAGPTRQDQLFTMTLQSLTVIVKVGPVRKSRWWGRMKKRIRK